MYKFKWPQLLFFPVTDHILNLTISAGFFFFILQISAYVCQDVFTYVEKNEHGRAPSLDL